MVFVFLDEYYLYECYLNELMEMPLHSREVDKEVEETTNSESIVSQRMSIAGGFLDVALFVADVEHLKFIFDTGKADIEYYDLLLGLLFSSLTLQVLYLCHFQTTIISI